MQLNAIAKELDNLSPALQDLLRTALAGANGEHMSVSARDQDLACMRINEALTTRTASAKAALAVV